MSMILPPELGGIESVGLTNLQMEVKLNHLNLDLAFLKWFLFVMLGLVDSIFYALAS